MSLKDQLLSVLEHSKQTRQAFIADLSDEQRSAAGSYEKWCAKDNVAHIAHWQEQRAARLAALARGEEPPPTPPHFEEANAACFERYCDSSWDEVQAYADQAHAQLVEAVRALDEDVLAVPAPDQQERKLWDEVVGSGYTHPLTHMATYYTEHGQPHKAGQLWREWSELVAPLSDSPEWQGGVHYNTACSLALAGNPDLAMSELRRALELRPSLTAWSRLDSDLQSLHSMPEYRELYAPAYWWKALDANPQAEALADQFMRTLTMFRDAVKACPANEWREGDTPCQRPAGLALHLVESIEFYSALKTGDRPSGRFDVDWEEKDASKLPSKDEILSYLDEVEEKLAGFLAQADLTAAEELFRWTGSTVLSRAAYSLRHTQHHVAEMALELTRREHEAPQWQ